MIWYLNNHSVTVVSFKSWWGGWPQWVQQLGGCFSASGKQFVGLHHLDQKFCCKTWKQNHPETDLFFMAFLLTAAYWYVGFLFFVVLLLVSQFSIHKHFVLLIVLVVCRTVSTWAFLGISDDTDALSCRVYKLILVSIQDYHRIDLQDHPAVNYYQVLQKNK